MTTHVPQILPTLAGSGAGRCPATRLGSGTGVYWDVVDVIVLPVCLLGVSVFGFNDTISSVPCTWRSLH